MLLIDHPLATPQANLAFDEAIIESVDPSQAYPTLDSSLDAELPRNPASLESLRLWEISTLCVVMGRGSKPTEVNLTACKKDGIPVLQRCSGGASIVAGPGCLMYSLLLSLENRPNLRSIDTAHAFVMQRIRQAVASIVPDIRLQGTCDLTLRERKFSGNAVRYKRDWLLYHGTLLYRFPLEAIPRYLEMPPRQPSYRQSREHANFLVNLECDSAQLRQALAKEWHANQPWTSHRHATVIHETAQRILAAKYAS